MIRFFPLLLLFAPATHSQTPPSKPPFCDQCSCVFPNNSSPVKVTCSKDVKSLIASPSSWVNPADNQSYPYVQMTFTNQQFFELNFTFPTSNLTYLSLANNDIYRITNSVFQNLQNMRTLILSNNDLELLSPDSFKGQYLPERLLPLKSLVVLKLDHNKLHTLNADLFEHTTDLEILDLSHNPLEVIDQHTLLAIDSLIHLKELYLGYTNIKTLPNQMLHTPIHLTLLDLSGNPLEEIPATFSEAHALTTLYLNDTGFVKLTKENGFPEMKTLTTLYLCHLENLEEIGRGALTGLINLEELHVTDNIKLTKIDQFALAKTETTGSVIWPLVKKLYLSDNKLAYLDSDFLARWDGLSELDIRRNPWTCECENQWLIEDLMPIYLKIDHQGASEVRCGAPVEMVDLTFVELYERKYQMRCLDSFGAEPEKDAALLIGILAGVLISIPVILFGMYAYQRRWFSFISLCDDSPASYSRRYYRSTSKDEDF